MALVDMIPGCYGTEDGLFARHPMDRERAREAFMAAQDEGVGLEEYVQMHSDYLSGRNFSEQHIADELEKVKSLEHYFDLD